MTGKIQAKIKWSVTLAMVLAMLFTLVAVASDWAVSVADVTVPIGEVDLVPGGSGDITINISVTGKQEGTATFEVYRDWTLSGSAFTGSNPQEFTVDPRDSKDAASTFSTTGKVTVAADQVAGTFTLVVGVFDITNSNANGAKLEAGTSGNYSVTVTVPSDSTPPTITITTPADGAVYTLNQAVIADYACEDDEGGSGLASCEGPVEDGEPIDTSSVGVKTFTVYAADNAGNTSSKTVSYSVVYKICALFDQTKSHKLGSTVPVKIQLCDVDGANVSSSSVVLNATGLVRVDPNAATALVEDSGNANPDNNFRYDAGLGGTGGYIYNLSTKGLSSGTWKLSFTVGGKTYTGYFVTFDVK